MPRCYMVKKDPSPIEGKPPCSPTEASVAPPCYTPHDHPTVAEPRSAQYAEPPRHVATQYEEPRSGDYAEKSGGINTEPSIRVYAETCGGATTNLRDDYNEPRNGIFTVLRAAEYTDTTLLTQYSAETRQTDYIEERQTAYVDSQQTDYSDPRHAQYSEPRSGDYAEPRTVRYLERDLTSYNEPRAAEYAEPRSIECSIDYSEECTVGYDESRPADYAEPHPAQYDEPRSADYAEPRAGDDSAPKSAEYEQPRVAEFAEPRSTEYAELQSMGSAVREHSAADTEAAHELLSLAASVPPLPPAAVVTVLRAPEPVMPLYTYSIQPTNIYIIAEEPNDPNLYAAAVQALTPSLQQVEYAQPQVNTTYITYQEPINPQPTIEYQQLYHATEPQPQLQTLTVPVMTESVPLSVPVSVIEATPAATPQPMETSPVPISVQVPVIEAVPLAQQHHSPSPTRDPLSDSDSETEPSTISVNEKKNKYDCNECGKRYATSSNLSRHKQTHRSLDSQAAKRCGECGKVYVSMPALAMHVLTHRMGHVCGVCGKQFSRPWLLRGHLRSHTGEKPYSCQFCTKSFADRSNLRAHLQTHSGDKKWECLRCNKTFALKSYLNKHQEAACSQDEDSK